LRPTSLPELVTSGLHPHWRVFVIAWDSQN
jgi:hypothetical protein